MSNNSVDKINHGEVFTKRWIVNSMLDLIGYTSDRDLSKLRLVEPSVGDGAFIIPIIERLLVSAQKYGAKSDDLHSSIFGMDVQIRHVEECRKKVRNLILKYGFDDIADSLVESWIQPGDFLLEEIPGEVDFVIGNPPYIRPENLDKSTEQLYRKRWHTMRGRSDIYIGFYERGLRILNKGGRLIYICADRWMHNSYGRLLRGFVSSRYAVEAIWRMHDVNAFETNVSAYPAITLISNSVQSDACVVDTSFNFNEHSAREVILFMRENIESASGHGWEGAKLPHWFSTDDLWPSGAPETIKLLESLQERFSALDSDGMTQISIGVATGNDRAYIVDSNTDEKVESDRLLPLVMTDDIRQGVLKQPQPSKLLLNPWDDKGNLVDLKDYPLFAQALERRPEIRDRYIAKKNPKLWYRTIDKIKPDVLYKPKLLLQDMKSRITPVYEPGGLYPHHNLYYIVSETWDLEVLGGLLMSRIAEGFVKAYGVKMRGGTMRFQTQYLRKIVVPQPNQLHESVAEDLRKAFRTRDYACADLAAEIAYGLPKGTSDRYFNR